MQNNYDVIIVGGGTAGASLAYLLAKENVDVVVIDKKNRENIGYKICGDAIAAHHYKETSIPRPREEHILYRVKGLKIFPYDMHYYVTILSRDGGYIVDRARYGEYLISEAEKRGAKIICNVKVTNPIIKNNFFIGVKGVDLKTNDNVNFYGKIIVDASGYPAVLVMKTPESWGLEKKVDITDKIVGYREIIRFSQPFNDDGYLWIHFTDKYAPGGYVWIFPHSRDGYYGNVGNGIQAGLGYPNPALLLSKYKSENDSTLFLFNNADVLEKGIWPIPNRRPRGKLVGNGFLAIGDAAIQIDPATSEGIGYGMFAAYIASKHIIKSLEKGDYSMKGLWGYAHEYMTSKYGMNQAKFDVFRYLLQASSDNDKLFAIKHKILTEKELSKARNEDIKVTSLEKLIKVLKGVIHRKLYVIKMLKYTLDKMKIAAKIYSEYPNSPDGYEKWKMREMMLFNEVKNVLKPYKITLK